MNSNHKRPRVARNNSKYDEDDRLSSFPEPILRHILSFLPTKYAALTSVLSTKWRDLFLGVPNIDLNEFLILHPEQQQKGKSVKNDDFMHFVNRRLMLCKTSSIPKFRLICKGLPESPGFNLWITNLLFRNVEVIEIEVYGGDSTPVPSKIFTSGTIVVLKLYGRNIVLKVPEFVSMPNLKVLDKTFLQMQFESSNNGRFREEYPLLEDLRIGGIRFPNDEAILNISVPSLKKFTLVDRWQEQCTIYIDVPLLQYFEYNCEGYRLPSIKINACKFQSLVAANLSIFTLPLFLCGDESFVNIIRTVHKVKSLHLSEGCLEGLHHFVGSLPKFPNLTYLELIARSDYQRKSMWSLLQCVPNLETLVCVMGDYGGEQGYGVPENEPPCLVQRVREIRIRNFKGAQVEFEVVRYLLQHGAVLERMTIDRPSNEIKEGPSSMLMQLLKYKRRSAKCQIEFELS